MLAKIGVITAADETAIASGLEAIARGNRGWRASRSTIALEDIHMNIEARLTERIGEAGQAAAHRAQPQRPGGDRFPALGARRDRRPDGAGRRRDAGAGATGPRRMRRSDARLHPPADRAAGHLRPPPAGLCRDAGPRPRPPRRLPAAAERVPAGSAALAGTSFPIDRSMTARGARASTGRRPIRSTRCRIATSRWSSWRRRRSRRCICRGWRRRS